MAEAKDRSQHWLMQAMEVQAMAEKMTHHHTKNTLMMIAAEYLHLSELAEKREHWLRPETYLTRQN